MKLCDRKNHRGEWPKCHRSSKVDTILLQITDELDPTAETCKVYSYSVSRVACKCLESQGRVKVTEAVLDKIGENFEAWVKANPSQELTWEDDYGKAALPESHLDLFDFRMLRTHSLIVRHTTEDSKESDT